MTTVASDKACIKPAVGLLDYEWFNCGASLHVDIFLGAHNSGSVKRGFYFLEKRRIRQLRASMPTYIKYGQKGGVDFKGLEGV